MYCGRHYFPRICRGGQCLCAVLTRLIRSANWPEYEERCLPLADRIFTQSNFVPCSLLPKSDSVTLQRDPIRPSFPGTLPVVWVLKTSVPVFRKTWFGASNVLGITKTYKYFSDNAYEQFECDFTEGSHSPQFSRDTPSCMGFKNLCPGVPQNLVRDAKCSGYYKNIQTFF